MNEISIKSFDVSKSPEFEKSFLKKTEIAIQAKRSKIGEAIYKIGKLKAPEENIVKRIRIGAMEVGMNKEDLEEVHICVLLYLDGDYINGNL